MSTTFTMRIDEGKKNLIAEYAATCGQSMSEFMLASALGVIEDATDLRELRAAKADYDADPVSYDVAQTRAMLAIS